MNKLAFRTLFVLIALALAVLLPGSLVAEEEAAKGQEDWKTLKQESKRQKIDSIAEETKSTVFEKAAKAEELYANAYGYAVFDNLKLAFGFSGGGGNGVAVEKASGNRTYMKMGTAGIGLGVGGHKYQVMFVFQDSKTFENFVEKGWKADASGSATAGTAGAGGQVGFVNGIAVYQINDAGLMANADITGTKYWKNKDLN